MNFKKTIIFSIFFFFLSQIIFAEKLVNKIVAVVGENFLTLYELNKMIEPFYKNIITSNMTDIQKEEIKKRLQKEILYRWIQDTLIETEAKKYNITVSNEEVENYLNEEIKTFGGKERFITELKKQGIPFEEYKKRIKKELLKIKFIQFQVRGKIVITDEELRNAYMEVIKNYDREPKYYLKVLLINGDKETAQKIYDKILKGESFEKIREEYSFTTEILNNVVLKKSEIDPEILKEVEKLKENQITQPIEKEGIFQIIKLLKKEKGIPPSFEELKPKLFQKLFEEKAQKYIEKWMKELKEKRYIRVFL
ncbi:MAG: hypothetical protein DRP29_02425 [Thermodesulfobacteriota bacterium]|nr:MAG: hypothetical protein DRP29_02425 [Thermodesulfobacteriota bacterium]